MNEADSQIAQGGHDLRGRAGAQTGSIFPKGDIAHIMQTIFDAPMPTVQIKETTRTGLERGEIGQEVNHLMGRLAGFVHGHGPPQASAPLELRANGKPDSHSCRN